MRWILLATEDSGDRAQLVKESTITMKMGISPYFILPLVFVPHHLTAVLTPRNA
jgi:hypothetical protein